MAGSAAPRVAPVGRSCKKAVAGAVFSRTGLTSLQTFGGLFATTGLRLDSFADAGSRPFDAEAPTAALVSLDLYLDLASPGGSTKPTRPLVIASPWESGCLWLVGHGLRRRRRRVHLPRLELLRVLRAVRRHKQTVSPSRLFTPLHSQSKLVQLGPQC